MIRRCLLILCLLSFPANAAATARLYDTKEHVIGYMKEWTIRKSESLVEIARRNCLGFNELTEANPGVDPFVPEPGTKLIIPTSWILPDVPPTASIVINLSELRLYHFFFDGGGRRKVETFPVGIGSEGNDTPLGSFRIKEKRESPSWRVPLSVRQERPELPPVVPPGEDNPLGSHALRLSEGSILIHGTNRPWGVGRRVSHGCVRLYPEDIPLFYDRVAVEDSVLIVRQPVKLGQRGGRVYVEVHDDPEEPDTLILMEALLLKRDVVGRIDTGKLLRTVLEKRGVPVDVTAEPDTFPVR